jgi:hypothetical protein
MKFNYIVGNPPYQEPKLDTDIKRDTNGSAMLFYTILQRLYPLFSCSMSMVTPAKIGSKKILFERGLKTYHLEGDVFNLGLQISVWRLVKNYQGKATIFYPSGTTELKDSPPIYPEHMKKDFEIFDRSKKHVRSLIRSTSELGNLGPGSKREMSHTKTGDFKYPVQVKMNSTVGKEYFMYSKIDFGDDESIVLPLSQKLYPGTVLKTKNNFNNLFYQIPTKGMTKDEIANVERYCTSVPLQIYSEFVAKVIGALRHWKIPEIAKKELTDEQIIESLGLEDDWEYILSIPKLKGHISFAEASIILSTK